MFVDQMIEDLDHLMAVAVSLLEISSSTESCVVQVLTEVLKSLLSGGRTNGTHGQSKISSTNSTLRREA